MRSRLTGCFLAAGILVTPILAGALDSPHDKAGTSATACSFCHALYSASPTGSYDYSPQCLSCHNQPGRGAHVQWDATDEATPGVGGTSHAWSRAATNPAYGAKANLGAAAAGFLVDGGKMQCVICHDPHTTAVPTHAGSISTTIPTGTAKVKTGNLIGDNTGTGTLTLAVTPTAVPRGYRIKLQSVTAGGGTFIISHDFGWKIDSWYKYEAGAWVFVGKDVDASNNPIPGRDFTNGTSVPLDLAGASITLSANSKAGDYWDFSITLPFLRYLNTTDAWCYQCHKEQQMNHLRARGVDTAYLPNGARKFSHPVGIPLGANGFGTDRDAPLDADGSATSSNADGFDGTSNVANPTNDIVLKGGVLGCTSCHAPHNADSNSLTVDVH